jgi:hypothetical protein
LAEGVVVGELFGTQPAELFDKGRVKYTDVCSRPTEAADTEESKPIEDFE